MQKEGRPLLLPGELDQQVQEYLKELRKHGVPINSGIVIATAQGFIMNKDGPNLT